MLSFDPGIVGGWHKKARNFLRERRMCFDAVCAVKSNSPLQNPAGSFIGSFVMSLNRGDLHQQHVFLPRSRNKPKKRRWQGDLVEQQNRFTMTIAQKPISGEGQRPAQDDRRSMTPRSGKGRLFVIGLRCGRLGNALDLYENVAGSPGDGLKLEPHDAR